MGLTALMLVLAANGLRGDKLPTKPMDTQLFAKAVVDSYDGNRSFSDNFYSLLVILCPNPEHCENNETVKEDNSVFINAGKAHAKNLTEFSEDFAIVYSNAGRLHGCCLPCSCDEKCTEKDNCCPAAEQNPRQPASGKRVIQECVFAGITSYIPNAVVTMAERDTGFSYFMVTDCFSANVSEDIVAGCRRPELNEFGPVFSTTTGRIYKNKFCAECNDDDHLISWKHVVLFNKDFSLTGQRQIPPTLKDLYDLLLRTRKFMNVFYIPPDNINTDKHTCVPSAEMEEQQNPCEGSFEFDSSRFLERACAAGGIVYQARARNFRNVFCFLCGSSTFPSSSECDGSSKKIDFSFSALLRSSQNLSAEARAVDKNAQCDCREYYDHIKTLCRRLLCPPGEYFALPECVCVEYLQNMRRMPVKIYMELKLEPPNRVALERLTTKLDHKAIKSLKAGLVKAFSTRWGPLDKDATHSTLLRETSISELDDVKFYIAVATTFTGTSDNKKLVKKIFTTLKSGMSTKILASSMTINLGPIFMIDGDLNLTAVGLARAINSSDIEIKPVESSHEDIGFVQTRTYKYAQTVSKLVFCQRVVLEEAELAMLRTRPRDLGVSPTYLSYVFREDDGSMCLNDFKVIFLASSGSNTLVMGCTGFILSLLLKWTI